MHVSQFSGRQDELRHLFLYISVRLTISDIWFTRTLLCSYVLHKQPICLHCI